MLRLSTCRFGADARTTPSCTCDNSLGGMETEYGRARHCCPTVQRLQWNPPAFGVELTFATRFENTIRQSFATITVCSIRRSYSNMLGLLMPHFTVAICTAKRPEMLGAALESVVNLTIPDNGTMSVVVIENDKMPTSREIIETFRAKVEIPIKYYLEPKIGIPYARNRSLVAALEENADWIAILDDDEVADPSWIKLLYDACKLYGADVATGSVRQLPETTPPCWWRPMSSLGKPTGFFRRDAYTNNVMFHSRLIAADGLALRFDERLTFGADDVDFFRRAHDKGARIVTVAESTVVEKVPASRLTLQRVLKRTFMVATANTYLNVLRQGRLNAIVRRLPSIIRRSVVGVLLLFFGSLIVLIKQVQGKKMLVKGLSSLTKAWGSVCGLAGRASDYYRRVDGF